MVSLDPASNYTAEYVASNEFFGAASTPLLARRRLQPRQDPSNHLFRIADGAHPHRVRSLGSLRHNGSDAAAQLVPETGQAELHNQTDEMTHSRQ